MTSTPCPRNLPQHFNGCTCTPVPGGVTAEVEVDLGLAHEDRVEADFAHAHLTDADQMAAPVEDPVLEEWRNTPTFVVMFEDLPPGTPAGWKGASVMSTNGTRWNLRFIPKGATTYADKTAAEDMIAFYDAANASEGRPHGQKVADYYVDTLMPANGPGVASGLNLYGGVPEWQIDAESMRGVLGWADMLRSDDRADA